MSGTGGGISVRAGDRVYMAPSGVQKERLQPDDLFVLDADANVVSAPTARWISSRVSAATSSRTRWRCVQIHRTWNQICAKFLDEHYHDDDEVRFVLEGDGVFDIRFGDDRWMRVVVEVGDLIVVPARRHRRFLLTDQKDIRCVRLFKDASGWVPHSRA